jgi:hypothetical protein
MGVWGEGASELLTALGRRLAEVTGEPRSAFFLRQRIDIAVQRGNALAVGGTFPASVTTTAEDDNGLSP